MFIAGLPSWPVVNTIQLTAQAFCPISKTRNGNGKRRRKLIDIKICHIYYVFVEKYTSSDFSYLILLL